VRPNQLFLITLNALSDCGHARSIVQSCERLLVPGGIRSLAAGDPKYRGYYTGDEDTSRKPAYHNGTVWAWPMPLYVEAAVKCGRLTLSQAGSLLAGVVENINTECLCHVSEIADGDAPHAQKGCRAQAWSVSEFLRVLLLIGVRTDLLKS
jgi:glycogen debranching enzyme